MEIREITTAVVQEIGKRDARIYELELVIEKLEQVLHRIHANAAESPEWIRHQIDEVLKDRVDTYHEWDCKGDKQ